MIDLRKGNCLEVMKTIKDNSIDAIITDPPYGTTACKWDSVIDFDLMWEQLNRIIKPNGAIVLFGSEPFSSALRMSNIKNYKYDWIWHKNKSGNIFQYKMRPMARTENISVFTNYPLTYQYIKNCKYYPELLDCNKMVKTAMTKNNRSVDTRPNHEYNLKKYKMKKTGYPENIIKIKNEKNKLHPTQKPIALMEYLIKTYTNEGETVLDFTMGSGSTMVAAQNLKRNGIGIEQEEKYFKIAEQRIKENEFKLF
jgi:site-specific DNA-methyltransferase (adenine-specific)